MPRSYSRAAGWLSAILTGAAGLLATLLGLRVLWTSHMEEADRQLRAAAAVYCQEPPGPAPVASLSGEAAAFHLISLTAPDGRTLANDTAWPPADRAALEAGGRFKTRTEADGTWRVMGIRQNGWSLRLALEAGEVVSETTTLAWKALLLTGSLSVIAGFAAAGFARKFTGRVEALAVAGRTGVLPDASDPPEIGHLKTVLREEWSAARAGLESARRFGMDAGHELRTPLSVIQASVESALRLPADDASLVFLESILAQCRRLRVTLDALQLLARADSGAVPLRSEAVDLTAMVRELLDDLGAESEQRDLRVNAILTPVTVQADPGLLRLALWNLMVNALRHNLPHGGTLTVHLPAPAREQPVILTIENTAVPLAADERDGIFDRFRRGRCAQQSGIPGQGLGLSLALAAASAHGGTLTLQRSDDAGTVFVLTLPAS